MWEKKEVELNVMNESGRMNNVKKWYGMGLDNDNEDDEGDEISVGRI